MKGVNYRELISDGKFSFSEEKEKAGLNLGFLLMFDVPRIYTAEFPTYLSRKLLQSNTSNLDELKVSNLAVIQKKVTSFVPNVNIEESNIFRGVGSATRSVFIFIKYKYKQQTPTTVGVEFI